ncbi:hypothetical protein SUDANB121_02948 [Nocardiopsis dassonvillei]|uniref:hypothetical protein n=1 Tax=Nocardiopsis dassonvillei TaxID=2014 RepID=UPI003F575FFD
MVKAPEFGRRLIIAVDAKGYGGSDELTQHHIQETLPELLGEAAAACRLDRSEWYVQFTGDGELAVLPPTVPEPVVLDEYVPAIVHGLRRHNLHRTEAGRLRLRLAVHHGSANLSRQSGHRSGSGIVTAARVVDGDPLRRALEESGADLVLAVTAPIHQDVVLPGHTRLTPEDFTLTTVRNKEYEEPVWVHTPGRAPAVSDTPAPGPETGRERPGPGPEQRESPAVSTVIHGDVDARNAVFGISS